MYKTIFWKLLKSSNNVFKFVFQLRIYFIGASQTAIFVDLQSLIMIFIKSYYDLEIYIRIDTACLANRKRCSKNRLYLISHNKKSKSLLNT